MVLTYYLVSGVAQSRFIHLITSGSGTGVSWLAMSGRPMERQLNWQLHLSHLPLGAHLGILPKRLTLAIRPGNSRSILLGSVLPFSDISFQKTTGSITVNMSQVSAFCSSGLYLQTISSGDTGYSVSSRVNSKSCIINAVPIASTSSSRVSVC